MSAPLSKRPCQAHNPATCAWHRNGVMADLHGVAADQALANGNIDAALQAQLPA